MSLPSGAKLVGAALFVGGALMLAFAISGLMPDGSGDFYGSNAFTQFIVDIGMLLVATFMVSIGMFFVIYGGERITHERGEGDGDRT